MKIALAIIITLAAPRVSLSAPVTTPVLASLDTAVERAVQTEAARARFATKEAKPRPYVRNSLIGAAAIGAGSGALTALIR